ncbi:Tetratricopeptide repeat-containing protein [Singulisphaera sp. GP187]|nr:Tetratricopeptide repeat-containing protein [Singulisphaera sp. GP187]
MAKTDFHRDVTQDQEFNVHLELGRVFESQKEYSAALDEYQKSLEACARRGFGAGIKGSGEKQALAHRRIGGTLDRLGRFAQAEDHYRLALKASPDDAKVWNDSGYSYYLQSRWADSERNLKTAAKLAPDDVRIQTNLGLTLAAAGKTDEALIALSKAGGTAIAHANLGYLLAAMGQNDQARAHYQTAIELQPNLAPARQALAALDAKDLKAAQVATTIPPPVPAADASIRRTTGPSVTPVSVVPLPNPLPTPR